VKVTFA